MGTIPYALSVQHFVSSVGADAGFAALVGLAILVLLYFAQARETASLRDQAAESAEQVQLLHNRLAQLTRAQASAPSAPSGTIAPAPAPPPAGLSRTARAAAFSRFAGPSPAHVSAGATAAPVGVPAGPPSAPAGVGAPALSAATRLIPTGDQGPISISARAVGDGQRSGIGAPAAAAAAGGAGGAGGGAATMAPPSPAPATAAGGANGGGPRPPAPAAAFPGQSSRPVARRIDPQTAGRPDLTRRSAGPPPPGLRSPGGSRVNRVVLAALGVLGVVAIVVVLLIVTSGGSGRSTSAASRSASTPTRTHPARHHRTRAAAALAPASVTVAVLNGTSVANLAHTVALQLGAAGFKQGTIATATDQTLTATVVAYLPGHRRAAQLVAKQLKLGPASIQPVDQSNQTVACPASSTPCAAQVVVSVGSDLASNT